MKDAEKKQLIDNAELLSHVVRQHLITITHHQSGKQVSQLESVGDKLYIQYDVGTPLREVNKHQLHKMIFTVVE